MLAFRGISTRFSEKNIYYSPELCLVPLSDGSCIEAQFNFDGEGLRETQVVAVCIKGCEFRMKQQRE